MQNFKIIFGKTIYKKFKKISKQKDNKNLLSKAFDKIEKKGPKAGKLLDSKLDLYEIKFKNPPFRIYFQIISNKKEAIIIDFEMKKSQDKQNLIINKIKEFLKIKK